MENLEEMGMDVIAKLKKKRYANRYIISNMIKIVIKKGPSNKAQDHTGSIMNSIQSLMMS